MIAPSTSDRRHPGKRPGVLSGTIGNRPASPGSHRAIGNASRTIVRDHAPHERLLTSANTNPTNARPVSAGLIPRGQSPPRHGAVEASRQRHGPVRPGRTTPRRAAEHQRLDHQVAIPAVAVKRETRAGRGRADRASRRAVTGQSMPASSEMRQGSRVEDHSQVVAIDGPAAAGKTTVARALADHLGAMLFDTGTLYRAVTLAAIRADVDLSDEVSLAELADRRHIDVTPPTTPDGRLYDVRLDGDDITWSIRDPRVDQHVSEVSAHQLVRDALLPTQRRIASAGPVVMVGRDIASVVVPGARLKVFLDASLQERARRRHAELLERGIVADLSEVEADLERRDVLDSTRSASPLRVAPGAHVLTTDGLSVEEVVARIEALMRHGADVVSNGQR